MMTWGEFKQWLSEQSVHDDEPLEQVEFYRKNTEDICLMWADDIHDGEMESSVSIGEVD